MSINVLEAACIESRGWKTCCVSVICSTMWRGGSEQLLSVECRVCVRQFNVAAVDGENCCDGPPQLQQEEMWRKRRLPGFSQLVCIF